MKKYKYICESCNSEMRVHFETNKAKPSWEADCTNCGSHRNVVNPRYLTKNEKVKVWNYK